MSDLQRFETGSSVPKNKDLPDKFELFSIHYQEDEKLISRIEQDFDYVKSESFSSASHYGISVYKRKNNE